MNDAAVQINELVQQLAGKLGFQIRRDANVWRFGLNYLELCTNSERAWVDLVVARGDTTITCTGLPVSAVERSFDQALAFAAKANKISSDAYNDELCEHDCTNAVAQT